MAQDDTSAGDHSSDGTERFVANRRTLLKSVGGLAAAGGLTSFATSANAKPELDISFNSVVDAVDDLNLDPNGNEPIDGKIENAASSGTLITFPDGTFKTGQMEFSGVQSFGLAAAEGASPTFEATFDGGSWVSFSDADDVLIEGIEFDMRERGGGVIKLKMDGSWVCRDVVKRGNHPDNTGGFHVAATGENSTGLLERCVVRNANGSSNGRGSVGIFVNKNHAGHLTIRDCVLSEFADNGIYGSPPGHGAGGSVGVVRGLYKNNNTAGVRLGSSGSYAKDVVIVQDSRAPAKNGSVVQRGIWIRQNGSDIQLDNCDVTVTSPGGGAGINLGQDANGSSGSITNCRIRQDSGSPAINVHGDTRPGWSGSANHLTGSGNLSAPDEWVACRGGDCDEPRTRARENAGGDSSTDTSDSPDLPKLLTIEGSEGSADYRFTVGGDLKKSTETGSIQSDDVVDGSTATGHVNGGTDAYRFSGEITDFELSAPVTVSVDGKEVDPKTLGASLLPRTLVFEGTGEKVTSFYSFSVSGDLERSGLLGSLDGADSVSGSSAEGSLWGPNRDGYRFSGDITDFEFSGPATVLVDGEEVDPKTLGERDLPNTLVIEGTGEKVTSTYSLSVSGDLEKSSALGTVNDGDSVSGSSAEGFVWGDGTDGYRFGGEVVGLNVDGVATVRVNGETVDPAELGLPNRIVLDGRNTAGETDYDIRVSGRLANDPALGPVESSDSVTDTTASGTIADDRDGYRFSGNLTRLTLDGDADITFEDNDS